MILPSIDFKISTYNYCKTEWRYFGVSGQIADLDPVNKSRDALIPVTIAPGPVVLYRCVAAASQTIASKVRSE